MKKLTKKEIAEGIQSIPIERVLLGATSKNGIKLTKKQKHFAEEVVKTGNKTEAYRRAYNHTGKRETASRNANTISASTNVQTYMNALNAQKEVEEYLLPTRLRAMAIHKLSHMALNDELPPAQQLKALELVGKMTEVALFSERREIVHTMDSNTLKAKLMDAVQLAINNSKSIHMKTKRTAQELLEELSANAIDVESKEITMGEMTSSNHELDSNSHFSDGDGLANPLPDDPTRGHTPFSDSHHGGHLHSIPHTQSQEINSCNAIVADSSVESSSYEIAIDKLQKIEGEGVQKTVWVEKAAFSQSIPVNDSEQNG